MTLASEGRSYPRVQGCFSRARARSERHGSSMERASPPDFETRDPMPAAEQLINARTQVAAAGGTTNADRWVIHQRDYAMLRNALGRLEYLYGLRLEVSDDPGLLGRGPVLKAASEK
jgi:hypothetical protein